MQRFMMIVGLTLVMATSTLAGDIPTGGIAPPTPTDGATSATSLGDIPSVPGEIPSGGYTQQISYAALNLIQIMLGAGV